MNVHFYLHGGSGTSSPLQLVVTHHGKRYRYSLGVSVDPRKWSTKKERSGNVKVDALLTRIKNEITTSVDELSSQREVVHAVGAALHGRGYYYGDTDTVTFMDYFDRWCSMDGTTERFKRASMKVVATLMGTKDSWDDIDESWHIRLMRRMDAEGYSANYKASVTKHIRCVLLAAFRDGYYRRENEWRKFKKKWETADTIYLTRDEVETLWNMDLSGPEAKARDLFLLGVYSAARYQNYSQFTMDNIKGDNLDFVQIKTGERVVIPLSPRIRTILERNGGASPVMSNQRLNSYIKVVCEKAGMTDVMTVRKHLGGKFDIRKVRRCDLVTSHTARRTGATLLYLSGVPVTLCRFLTGHSSDEMFMKYIKLRREEAADKLRDNPFFK